MTLVAIWDWLAEDCILMGSSVAISLRLLCVNHLCTYDNYDNTRIKDRVLYRENHALDSRLRNNMLTL